MLSRFIIIAILFLTFILSFSNAIAQNDEFIINVQKNIEKAEKEKALRTPDENKLATGLYDLMRLAEESDTSAEKRAKLSNLLMRDKYLKTDAKERISLIVEFDSLKDAKGVEQIIQSVGGEIEHIGLVPYIRCKIHPKKLRHLISSKTILSIKKVITGHTRVTSVGDIQLKADRVRAEYNVRGLNVKIGVISDGVDNLSQVSSAQELSNVHVIKAGSGNEGTAMLEIVHDLAPDALLAFYSGIQSYEDLADGIVALKNDGCKVIVDDLGFLDEPFFTDEDNKLGSAIRSFISGGGIYVSAAGNDNYNLSNWRYPLTYSGATDLMGDINYFFQYPYLEVVVPKNSTGGIWFQWASQWSNPSDYNIYIFDETGANLICSGNRQQSSIIPPREEVSVENNTNTDKLYRIVIKSFARCNNDEKFMINCTENLKLNNSLTSNNHVYGHPGYPKVIGVAAYDADYQSDIAKFSSWGPLHMYSKAASSWTDQETPVITATSGVHTFVGSAGYWTDPFSGTSAAAPHIAAIAGLYFSKFSTKTRENFFQDLTQSAAPISDGHGNVLTGGAWHRQAGYGKVDALACLQHSDAPVFSPPSCTIGTSGCGNSSGVDVSIFTSVLGANIYYTDDGFSEPTTSSTLYIGPIHISSTETIRAKAFLGDYQSPTSRATYALAGTASISVGAIGPTQIQLGQSTVKTTINFTRYLQYPICICYDGGGFGEEFGSGAQVSYKIDNQSSVYVTGTARGTGGNFSFEYDFSEGNHTVEIDQGETSPGNCVLTFGGAPGRESTASVSFTVHIDKQVQVTVKNEFKYPNNTIKNGGFVNVDGTDIDTDPIGKQYTTTFIKGSTHTFTANEQLYVRYWRGFNRYPEHDGGWIDPDPSVLPKFTPTINPIVKDLSGAYIAKYRV
jgi:hypothetical protein